MLLRKSGAEGRSIASFKRPLWGALTRREKKGFVYRPFRARGSAE